MAVRRRSIKMRPDERAELVKLYLELKIPVDQYEHRPEDLAHLSTSWNAATGRSESTGDILHYMRNQRKCGKWVTFDGAHEPVPPRAKFSADDVEVLVEIYHEHVAGLGVGSDYLAYDEQFQQFLSREFADRRGRVVAPGELVAKITELRKRGMLPKIETSDDDAEDLGFGDIDAVGT